MPCPSSPNSCHVQHLPHYASLCLVLPRPASLCLVKYQYASSHASSAQYPSNSLNCFCDVVIILGMASGNRARITARCTTSQSAQRTPASKLPGRNGIRTHVRGSFALSKVAVSGVYAAAIPVGQDQLAKTVVPQLNSVQTSIARRYLICLACSR